MRQRLKKSPRKDAPWVNDTETGRRIFKGPYGPCDHYKEFSHQVARDILHEIQSFVAQRESEKAYVLAAGEHAGLPDRFYVICIKCGAAQPYIRKDRNLASSRALPCKPRSARPTDLPSNELTDQLVKARETVSSYKVIAAKRNNYAAYVLLERIDTQLASAHLIAKELVGG